MRGTYWPKLAGKNPVTPCFRSFLPKATPSPARRCRSSVSTRSLTHGPAKMTTPRYVLLACCDYYTSYLGLTCHRQDAYTGNDEKGSVAEAQSVDDNSVPFSAIPSKSNTTSPNETQCFGFDQIFMEGGEVGEPDVRDAIMSLYSELTLRAIIQLVNFDMLSHLVEHLPHTAIASGLKAAMEATFQEPSVQAVTARSARSRSVFGSPSHDATHAIKVEELEVQTNKTRSVRCCPVSKMGLKTTSWQPTMPTQTARSSAFATQQQSSAHQPSLVALPPIAAYSPPRCYHTFFWAPRRPSPLRQSSTPWLNSRLPLSTVSSPISHPQHASSGDDRKVQRRRERIARPLLNTVLEHNATRLFGSPSPAALELLSRRATNSRPPASSPVTPMDVHAPMPSLPSTSKRSTSPLRVQSGARQLPKPASSSSSAKTGTTTATSPQRRAACTRSSSPPRIAPKSPTSSAASGCSSTKSPSKSPSRSPTREPLQACSPRTTCKTAPSPSPLPPKPSSRSPNRSPTQETAKAKKSSTPLKPARLSNKENSPMPIASLSRATSPPRQLRASSSNQRSIWR
jgi:hypothetical protein